MRTYRHDQFAFALIVLGLLARSLLAFNLNLSNDEAYAVAVSREFSVSFFDHPPIAFWLAGLSASCLGEHPFLIRVPFLIMGTGTAFFLWRVARALGGARVGLWAMMIWHFTPHLLTASGVFAVPEGPLNLFCLAGLWVLSFDLKEPRETPRAAVWLAAGGCLALALASKYNAGLFALAVFAFLLVDPRCRKWLGHWQPWAGATVGLLGLLPVLAFGFQTEWSSFRFHSGRTGAGFDLGNLATMYFNQFSQLAYVNMIVLIGGIWYGFQSKEALARIILFISLFGMLFFAPTYAFGTYTHSHWTMPAWLMAVPLGALWLCRSTGAMRVMRWVVAAWWMLFTTISSIGFYEIATGRLTEQVGALTPIVKQNKMFDLSGASQWLEQSGWLDGITTIGVEDWESGGRVSTMLHGRFGIKAMGTDPRHFQFHKAFAESRPPIFVQVGITADREVLDREALSTMRRHGALIGRTEYFDVMHGGFPLVTVAVRRLIW